MMPVVIPKRTNALLDWVERRSRNPVTMFSVALVATLVTSLWLPVLATAMATAVVSWLLTRAYYSRRIRCVRAELDDALRKQGDLGHELAMAHRRLAETAPTLGIPYIREAASRE